MPAAFYQIKLKFVKKKRNSKSHSHLVIHNVHSTRVIRHITLTEHVDVIAARVVARFNVINSVRDAIAGEKIL